MAVRTAEAANPCASVSNHSVTGEERRAAECEQACAAMDRHFGEQGPGEMKNAADAAFKNQARWSLRALS
jgi:hypothetical protein